MSGQPTYKALKPILFRGLCTWVVCPTQRPLWLHGMLLVGIEHLQAAEAEGRRMFAGRDVPGHDLLGDTLGRLRMLGQDSCSDFYYPIGGLAQVLRSTTPNTFEHELKYHAHAARTAVAMISSGLCRFVPICRSSSWLNSHTSGQTTSVGADHFRPVVLLRQVAESAT